MTKKLLSLLCAGVLAISVLAGCGGTQTSSGGSEAGNTAAAQNGSGSQDQGTAAGDQGTSGEVFEMAMEVLNFGFEDPDMQMVEDAVNEITVPKIGVKVKFVQVSIGEHATKLGLMISGGDKIDLYCSALTSPAALAAEGLIVDITDYVKNSEILSSYGETAVAGATVNGKIYGFPMGLYPASARSFLYDQDLAEQYHIEVPEEIHNREELEAVFEQVKNSGMDVYATTLGVGVMQETQWLTRPEVLGDGNSLSYGVVLDPSKGNEIVNWYATDEYMTQCKMLRDWYEAGYVIPDSMTNNYSTVDSISLGLVFGVSLSDGASGVSGMQAMTGKRLGAAHMQDLYVSGSAGDCWVLPATCGNPEKVISFLEELYTNPELSNLLQFGVEGAHYVTREGSMIIDYPEGIDSTNVGYGNFGNSYGDSAKMYKRPPMTDELIQKIPDYGYGSPIATISPYAGYTFDTTEVATALTAVTAVIGQYGPSLACGMVDPEEVVPQFIDALEAAGIQQVIDANQAQLDAWLAQK